jgi:hypothetical protein
MPLRKSAGCLSLVRFLGKQEMNMTLKKAQGYPFLDYLVWTRKQGKKSTRVFVKIR